ncbi:hypothetical protein [Paenibacillus elgii]|uniref:hypothetical protein n=1 Tax=Paenibacillus elgii TaxID=189691 RepID=UPI000FDC8F9C|nr:hypothetical protein [Paenibacillus elgii]NEN87380.1 hypothetical protein [Paenibacillus elgii]
MLMFHFFKQAKKTNPTLEEQIHALLGLGITFTDDTGTLINNLLVHFDRESYEEDPFYLLLTITGADLLDENENEIRMSYDVWCFDAECIEDENIYTMLLRHFVNLAKGEFPLENIESNLDFDEQEAEISFDLDGRHYNWILEMNDDWVNIDLFKKLGKLALKRNRDKQYIYFNDGQNLTFMYCDKIVLKKLNELTDKKFVSLA